LKNHISGGSHFELSNMAAPLRIGFGSRKIWTEHIKNFQCTNFHAFVQICTFPYENPPNSLDYFCTDKKESLICLLAFAPALEGHFRIARPVRLSVPWRSCLGYRKAGCLQLSHRQPPQMCGLLSGCGVFAITQVVYFSSTWMLVRGPPSS